MKNDYLKEVFFDSMIAESLINPEKNNYSLDILATDYFNYSKVSYDSLFSKGDKQRSIVEVPLEKISQCNTIGISSGASAPEVLVQNFIEKIKEKFNVEIQEVEIVKENVTFKVPGKLN